MSIKRIQVSPRMSQAVVHGDTVYLAGVIASDAPGAPAAEQTKNIVDKIDGLLAEAGTDKSKLLSANIWLADITDFDAMTGVWDAWIDPDNPPARACVQSTLARSQFTVEIMAVAAR